MFQRVSSNAETPLCCWLLSWPEGRELPGVHTILPPNTLCRVVWTCLSGHPGLVSVVPRWVSGHGSLVTAGDILPWDPSHPPSSPSHPRQHPQWNSPTFLTSHHEYSHCPTFSEGKWFYKIVLQCINVTISKAKCTFYFMDPCHDLKRVGRKFRDLHDMIRSCIHGFMLTTCWAHDCWEISW